MREEEVDGRHPHTPEESLVTTTGRNKEEEVVMDREGSGDDGEGSRSLNAVGAHTRVSC